MRKNIEKNAPVLVVQKLTRFGVRLRVRILFNTSVTPKTGQFLDPQNGGIFQYFAHFGAIFCGVFRLPSATDVVFLHAC